MYTSGARTTHIAFTTAQYFTGFAHRDRCGGRCVRRPCRRGGWIVFGLRGPYFAIGTLGVAVAGAELVASWEWVGAARGISMPVFPGAPQTQKLFFYFLLFALAFVVLLFLRWLYSTNFGMAINAIRDDEEKAEAMGLYTRRYKRTAWAIAGVFPRHRRRDFRQHDRLHRAARHRLPDHDLQYLHGADGAAGRQRHVLGTGHRRGRLPRHQGSDLDLFPRLAIRRPRPAHRHHHRLFPARHRRLGDRKVSGAIRSRSVAPKEREVRARAIELAPHAGGAE